MSLAIGELLTLATKAARGAGFNWSMASEAGYATAWLEERGAAGIGSLACYLQWVDANGIPEPSSDILTGNIDLDLSRCPIQIGCYIADSRWDNNAIALQIRQPLLLLPFVAMATKDASIMCEVDERQIIVSKNEVDDNAIDIANTEIASVSWTKRDSSIRPTQKNSRASDDTASIRTLLNFAKKTYAPATEASRMAGAGAGTSDND